MDTAADVKKILSALRDRPVGVDGDRLDERRTRALPILRSKLRTLQMARRRRARLSKLGWVAFGAALLGAALLSFTSRVGTAGRMAQGEPASAILLEQASGIVLWQAPGGHAARGLASGERLTSPHSGQISSSGPARLRTTDGLTLALSPMTRIEVSGLSAPASDRHVRLDDGEVRCEVPKLRQGEHFSVVTRDLRVIVRGTVFSVRAATADRTSCVRVQDGRVLVQGAGNEILLGAGQSFGCEEEAMPASAAVQAVPVARASREPPRRQAGTLGAEADLLGAGLAAEQGGNPARARERLETLLRLYPNSPLAPEARQALARIGGANGTH